MHTETPVRTETPVHTETPVRAETPVHTETPVCAETTAHLFLFSSFQSTNKTVSQQTDSGEKDRQVLRHTGSLGETEFSFI